MLSTWSPPWRAWFRAPPPDPVPDLVARLATLEAQARHAQQDMARLETANSALRQDVATGQQHQAEQAARIASLVRITENQQMVMQEQGSLVYTLREQVTESQQARQIQRTLIDELRVQLDGQQAEIAELRTQLVRITEDRDFQIQRRTALQLAVDELKRELAKAETVLRAHGWTTEYDGVGRDGSPNPDP